MTNHQYVRVFTMFCQAQTTSVYIKHSQSIVTCSPVHEMHKCLLYISKSISRIFTGGNSSNKLHFYKFLHQLHPCYLVYIEKIFGTLQFCITLWFCQKYSVQFCQCVISSSFALMTKNKNDCHPLLCRYQLGM